MKHLCFFPDCGAMTNNVRYCSNACELADQKAQEEFNLLPVKHQLYPFGSHVNITECEERFEEGNVL